MTPQDLYNDPSKIAWHEPIVIDFETYYDRDYSPHNVTTEKYIRCEQFECIGVSVKHGARPTDFFPRETGIDYIRRLAAANPASPVVAHNCNFDLGILAFRYDIHPNFTVDTCIMAKLCGLDRVAGGVSLAKITGFLAERGVLHTVKGTEVHNMVGVHAEDMTREQWQAYGDYCTLDVDLTYGSYMHMLDKVPTSELIMADITTKMWTQSKFHIDVPLLTSYLQKLKNEKQARLESLAKELGLADVTALLSTLRSSAKFAQLLSRYTEVPTKWSKKKNMYVPALAKTDKGFLKLLGHENPTVSLLVETKLGVSSSINETRTSNFLDVASRGHFPVPLRYASAHTGRYGGGDSGTAKGGTNVQNLPKRTGDLTLRRSLTASEDHVVIASDSTQIECLSGDGLVLTDNDLKQIVNISIDDLLWDGVEYVSHNGVIFKGVKDVITYSEITATPEHIVFTADGRKLTLDEAAAERAELLVGERAGQPVWAVDYTEQTNTLRWAGKDKSFVQSSERRFTERGNLITGTIPVYDIVNAGPRNRFCYNGMIVSNCRINAYMADQQDLIEVFASGKDPYVDMATVIFSKSYDEIYHEAKVVGSKDGKRMRNLGKETSLACIGRGTEVLCLRGWVPIQDVTSTDLLWDGEAWVSHDGVVPMGEKDCMGFGGAVMTPDHRVYDGHGWEEAQNADTLGAISWATTNLPYEEYH